MGVGVFSGFQCSIDVGFDFPQDLRFLPEIFERCIVGIVLPFQFCIPGLDCFAVVFTVGKILGQQPIGSIELIQFCLVLGFIFLLGFCEFDTEYFVRNRLQPLVSIPGIRKFLKVFHLCGLDIQLRFLFIHDAASLGNKSFQRFHIGDAMLLQESDDLAEFLQIVGFCLLGICTGIALIEVNL